MVYPGQHAVQLSAEGYTVLDDIYSAEELSEISAAIAAADTSTPAFRKTDDLFAVRQCLQHIPSLQPLLFTPRLRNVIASFFGEDYAVIKSIYFDKPALSNWFVAWHQDLTIMVDQKISLPGYGPWTVKQQQFAVQPPLAILENIFTIRIHLDDTDASNGALRVIPGSHRKGIYRPETIDWTKETSTHCNVKRGGVMIMRPLLLHASDRATGNSNRRVVHIEFSNSVLPQGIQWAEYLIHDR